jgi:hypothetical protein
LQKHEVRLRAEGTVVAKHLVSTVSSKQASVAFQERQATPGSLSANQIAALRANTVVSLKSETLASAFPANMAVLSRITTLVWESISMAFQA